MTCCTIYMLRLGPPLKGGSSLYAKRLFIHACSIWGRRLYSSIYMCWNSSQSYKYFDFVCVHYFSKFTAQLGGGTFVINLKRKRNKFSLQLVIELFASQLRFLTLEMKICMLCNCYMYETILHYIELPKSHLEIGSAPQEGHHLFRAMFGEISWHNGSRS